MGVLYVFKLFKNHNATLAKGNRQEHYLSANYVDG